MRDIAKLQKKYPKYARILEKSPLTPSFRLSIQYPSPDTISHNNHTNLINSPCKNHKSNHKSQLPLKTLENQKKNINFASAKRIIAAEQNILEASSGLTAGANRQGEVGEWLKPPVC